MSIVVVLDSRVDEEVLVGFDDEGEDRRDPDLARYFSKRVHN